MDNSQKVKVTPISLLLATPTKKGQTVKVYYQHQERLYQTSLEVEGLTISTLVELVVEKINQNKELSLQTDSSNYQLFAAKRDGSLDCSLPALEPTYNVLKSRIKRFHLVPLMPSKPFYPVLPSKGTISSIKSQINIRPLEKSFQPLQNCDKKDNFSFCSLFCISKKQPIY